MEKNTNKRIQFSNNSIDYLRNLYIFYLKSLTYIYLKYMIISKYK